MTSRIRAIVALAALACTLAEAAGAEDIQWHGFAGGKSMQRYAPLDQINAENVARLKLAWQRPGLDPKINDVFPDLVPSNNLRGMPIFVDGLLYAPNAAGLVEAFDAATGKTVWVQSLPRTYRGNGGFFGLKGVDYWSSGDDARIISIRGEYLYAWDAKTGKPVTSFGDGGSVYIGWPNSEHYSFFTSSAPTVAGGVIVVGGTGNSPEGGGTGDNGVMREANPENIRGYDVRTGRQLWTFHVVPQDSEPGNESWGRESWMTAGNQGNWGGVSYDPELDYIYVPTGAPTASYFGGHRPGNNIGANTLYCLDAKTGREIWHFQLVHHDLWDYDVATNPVLGDVNVGGRTIKAVIVTGKTGLLYVFDRQTGAPVWPIEERAVPASTVPGEAASPTQPYQLPPYDRHGFKESDLVDFTPALRAEARKFVSQYVTGPAFNPPSVIDAAPGGKKGSLVIPGVFGTGSWNTGTFDPETGIYYAVSETTVDVYGLEKLAPPATLEYSILDHRPQAEQQVSFNGVTQPSANGARGWLPTALMDALPSKVPLLKPPYGRITAYDLNTAKIMWVAPNGDSPRVRENPALKGVKLPPLLGNPTRAAGLVTKSLFFIADGRRPTDKPGEAKLRAYDKKTGRVVSEFVLPGGTTNGPMSYEVNGKQYIVLPVASSSGPSWIALTAE